MAPIGVTLRVKGAGSEVDSILFALLPYLDGSRSGVDPPGTVGLNGLKSSSCECSHFCRLLHQHVGPPLSTNWNGDLIAPSFWLKSKANRMLACVISRSFA